MPLTKVSKNIKRNIDARCLKCIVDIKPAFIMGKLKGSQGGGGGSGVDQGRKGHNFF